jgi:hypothetical protein
MHHSYARAMITARLADAEQRRLGRLAARAEPGGTRTVRTVRITS